MPAYIRPLFCEGKGPFRWAALSGDPADIAATDAAILDLFPDNEPLARWIRMAQEKVHFQGLPARICWLGYGERHLAGLRFNELVAARRACRRRSCSAVTTSTAARSPRRTGRPRRMADGSDAIADWPLLNALVNTASGASWVSIHHGGGVGIGRSIHAGPGLRGRRHPAGRAKAGAGAHQRPGHGRDPARGRRLRRGRRGGRAAGRPRPDAVVTHPGTLARSARVRVGVRGGVRSGVRAGVRAGVCGTVGVAAAGRPGPGHRRLPAVLLDPGRRGTAGPGSRLRPGTGSCAPARTATATCGPGGTCPGCGGRSGGARPPWPPGATWTRCRTAAPTTGRWAWCPRSRRSTSSARAGFTPARPIAVAAFTEEEGGRFGVACLGSRLLTGAIDPAQARGLRDGDGITLAEAMQAAGQDPDRSARDEDLLARLGCYVELHIEQGRALADLDAALGIAEGIWPHGRWRLDFAGQADHAGTAALADRRDPMIPLRGHRAGRPRRPRSSAAPGPRSAR